MKIFLLFSILVVLVYCTEIQAKEIAAVVEINHQEERRYPGDCVNDGEGCTFDCNCCGKNSYCYKSFFTGHHCAEGEKAHCENKMEICYGYADKHGTCD
nr:venom protein [Lampona murina]